MTFSDAFQGVTALVALGTLIVGISNARRIKSVHIELNSRLTQLLALNKTASHAEGVAQGRQERNNELDT